jgi:hypothetical protein
MGVLNAKFDAEFESVLKRTKMAHKSERLRTFAHSNKSQALFSVTFS